MKKPEKTFIILAHFLFLAGLLMGCSGPGSINNNINGSENNFPDNSFIGIDNNQEEAGLFRIGISNAFITSEYRTQMIDDLLATNQEYMNLGLTEELIIYSENTDIDGQIRQIENLMKQNIDALIVYPDNSDALIEFLEEIAASGVVVISIGLEIDAEGVISVAHNQKERAFSSASWLAEEIQTGTIALIEAEDGRPEYRYQMEGVQAAFENHPALNVLGSQTDGMNDAASQVLMADLLVTYPDLAGYWILEGMATGALKAVMAAQPAIWPRGIGEGSIEFLKLWKEVLETYPDAKFIVVTDAPGVGAAGLRIAVELLKGRVFKDGVLGGQFGSTVTIPIPLIVTPENFTDVYSEYVIEGDYLDFYLLDYILTIEEVNVFFK